MALADVNDHLKSKGLWFGVGTIIDATLILASTLRSRVIHSTEAPSANVHDGQVDGQVVSGLMHGAETKVWGDRAYQGQRAAIRVAAPAAQDLTHRSWARLRLLSEAERAENATKSFVRAKGEHSALVIKRNFGFTHVPYRGLVKNRTRFEVLCARESLPQAVWCVPILSRLTGELRLMEAKVPHSTPKIDGEAINIGRKLIGISVNPKINPIARLISGSLES